MRSKSMAKIILNVVKSQKCPYLLYEIDVAENDSDDRFWTRSINNADFAHAQRTKLLKTSDCRNFPLLQEIWVALALSGL